MTSLTRTKLHIDGRLRNEATLPETLIAEVDRGVRLSFTEREKELEQ